MSELQKAYPGFMDISFDQVDFDKSETDSDSRWDTDISHNEKLVLKDSLIIKK